MDKKVAGSAPDDGDDKPTIARVIKQIKAGLLAPRTLDGATRRYCVAYMLCTGISYVELAEFFQRSERTINRDVRAIRKSNATYYGEFTVEEVCGNLVRDYYTTLQQIRRAAHDRSATPRDKIEAFRRAFGMQIDMVGMLGRFGIMKGPTRAAPVLPPEIDEDLCSPDES